MYEYFARMGMWPEWALEPHEHLGEERFKFQMGPVNWWAKEFFLDPTATELTRLDNYLTLVFGNQLDTVAEFQKEHPIVGAPLGPVGVSGKVRALTYGEGDMAARREAFRFLWSLHRTMLINASKQKEWDVKSKHYQAAAEFESQLEKAERAHERYMKSIQVRSGDEQ